MKSNWNVIVHLWKWRMRTDLEMRVLVQICAAFAAHAGSLAWICSRFLGCVLSFHLQSIAHCPIICLLKMFQVYSHNFKIYSLKWAYHSGFLWCSRLLLFPRFLDNTHTQTQTHTHSLFSKLVSPCIHTPILTYINTHILSHIDLYIQKCTDVLIYMQFLLYNSSV